MEAERGEFKDHWRELDEYVYPVSVGSNENRNARLDNTGEMANEIFSATLAGNLANPATPWFEIEPVAESEREDKEIMAWAEIATRLFRSILSDHRTNFYASTFTEAMEIGARGNVGSEVIESKNGAPFVCISQPITCLHIAENDEGFVDRVHKVQKYTAQQAIDRFGDKVSDKVKQAHANKRSEKFTYLQTFAPRERYDPDKGGPLNMPIESVVIEKDSKHLVEETGFNENPIPVGRWSVKAGKTYAEGPASKALPELRLLNRIAQSRNLALERDADPTIFGRDDGLPGGILDLSPGVYNKLGFDPRELVFLGSNADKSGRIEAMVEELRLMVMRHFYVDQLQMVNGTNMTATEVIDRRNERFAIQAPLSGRVRDELLVKKLERAFSICIRKRLIPPPPRASNLKIRFISQYEQAQRGRELDSINLFIATAAPIIEAFPDARDAIKAYDLLKEVHDIVNAPQSILASKEEVEAIAQSRAQQQQMEQAAMLAQTGAAAAKDAAQAGIL